MKNKQNFPNMGNGSASGKGIQVAATKTKGGGFNLNITCDRCGGELCETDKYGMRCKKDCYAKENRAAYKELNKMLFTLTGIKNVMDVDSHPKSRS